jgi:hypothetical protein
MRNQHRMKDFKSLLFKLFHRERAQSLVMSSIVSYMREDSTGKFSETEIKSALNTMQDDNQIMLSDETVFLI